MPTLCLIKTQILFSTVNSLLVIHHVLTRGAVDLAYKLHGKEPKGGIPVIILHGLLGSKKNWETLSKKFASSLNKSVVTVDLRNHGESPHANSHAYTDLAADVHQLMKKLSIGKADVIGHSMGGRTAMVLALTHPTSVTRLVPVDISPVSTPGILNDFFPRLMDVLKTCNIESKPTVSAAKAHVKEKIYASGIVPRDAPIHFILMNIGIRPDKKVGWNCNIDVLKKNFSEISTFPKEMSGKTFNGPTLFIGGEDSNYLPREDLTGIKAFFPKAELKYVPRVGHNVHAEDPTTFFKFVHEFLSKK